MRNTHFDKVVGSQPNLSTIVSGGSNTSQHQTLSSPSPLSQYTANGDNQKLHTTSPPLTQSQGN